MKNSISGFITIPSLMHNNMDNIGDIYIGNICRMPRLSRIVLCGKCWWSQSKKTGAVVTVENQNIIGGLGAAVCEVLCENHPVPVKRLGVPDKFGEVATEDYLFNKHKFGIKHIVAACENLAERK